MPLTPIARRLQYFRTYSQSVAPVKSARGRQRTPEERLTAGRLEPQRVIVRDHRWSVAPRLDLELHRPLSGQPVDGMQQQWAIEALAARLRDHAGRVDDADPPPFVLGERCAHESDQP